MDDACELCRQDGGELLYRDAELRVVLVDDASHPGFCRVIWNAHVREMTDLPEAQRARLMATVWRVEEVLREVLRPDKINLASLGNMTPHLHWHVIPRHVDDPQFPDAVWAAPRRAADPAPRRALLLALRQALRARLESHRDGGRP